MRQRKKGPSSSGIRRCAFCSLFTFASFLETVVSSCNALSVTAAAATAAAAVREAPDLSGGIRFTHRKDATLTDERRRQMKMASGSGSLAAAIETEAAAPPLLSINPSPRPPQAKTTHVVIASFGEPEPYHAISLYFASKLEGGTVHHVIMHTYGKGHEQGELNLRVAKEVEEEALDGAATAAGRHQAHNYRQQPSVPWRTIYHRLRVQRSNIDLSTEDSYLALAQSYLHSSARQVDYELLCFARFIGLHRFCTERGIDELTFLDADVIAFDRDFLTKVRIPANHSLWTVHDRSSFLASMTCSAIGDFVDFMVDFYEQPDRRKIVSTIDTYGDDELDPTKLQGLRDREPAFDSLGVKPKLFSDMYLFDLFLHDQLAHSKMDGVRGDLHGAEGSSLPQITETPQATTLPPRSVRKEERDETNKTDPALKNTREAATANTRPTLPPYVQDWYAPSEQTRSYFALIENMRSVTQVPHTRAWLCLDQALFNAHFRINITSQLARMNGGGGVPDGAGGSFEPFAGAHFQGDCKAKMMQLLYVDVMRAIEETPDVVN